MSLLDEDLSVKTDNHILIQNVYFMGACEKLNNFSKIYKPLLKFGAIVLERSTCTFYVYGFDGWVSLKELFENFKIEGDELNAIYKVLCSYFSLMTTANTADNYPKNIFIYS